MTLVIATAMVLCWLLGILNPAMIGFIGAFLFAASGVDFDTAFHGFGTETPWFLYGALLLLGAAERSGLTRLIGAYTPRAILRAPRTMALALIVLAYTLARAVPSSLACATILMVLALSWGREARNLGTAKLSLVAGYAGVMFQHPHLVAGPYLIAGWDLAAGIALLASVLWPQVRATHALPVPDMSDVAVDAGRVNLRIAAPLMIAVVLWLSTPLHRVSPALVGLACGLISWLPGLAEAGKHGPTADHLAVIFAGTAITIPAVLLETQTIDVVLRAWTEANQSSGIVPDDLAAYWTTVVYRILSPDGARPALPDLSDALRSTAIWSYAGSTLFSLHQSPALILAMAVGGCRPKHVLMTGLFVLILGSLVVILF